jgi:hypothetical protein
VLLLLWLLGRLRLRLLLTESGFEDGRAEGEAAGGVGVRVRLGGRGPGALLCLLCRRLLCGACLFDDAVGAAPRALDLRVRRGAVGSATEARAVAVERPGALRAGELGLTRGSAGVVLPRLATGAAVARAGPAKARAQPNVGAGGRPVRRRGARFVVAVDPPVGTVEGGRPVADAAREVDEGTDRIHASRHRRADLDEVDETTAGVVLELRQHRAESEARVVGLADVAGVMLHGGRTMLAAPLLGREQCREVLGQVERHSDGVRDERGGHRPAALLRLHHAAIAEAWGRRSRRGVLAGCEHVCRSGRREITAGVGRRLPERAGRRGRLHNGCRRGLRRRRCDSRCAAHG